MSDTYEDNVDDSEMVTSAGQGHRFVTEFQQETRRLALSKSAVNYYLRATMAFKQARFWTNVSYP